MSDVARRLGNYATLGLLVGAVFALGSSLFGPDEYICNSPGSAGGQCPSADATAAEIEPLVITADLTMRSDRAGTIEFGADGITLDCAGHEIRGSGTAGIRVDGRSNVTIRNCRVVGFDRGIELVDTVDSRVLGNTAEAGAVGFSLTGSDGNQLKDNEAVLAELGIGLSGSDSNEIVGNSTVRGASGIFVFSSHRNTLGDNAVFNAQRGVNVVGNANKVDGNEIDMTETGRDGLSVEGSNNEVTNNTFTGGRSGIEIQGDAAKVTGNELTNVDYGIEVAGTDHLVADNVIDSRYVGITIGASESTISGNQVRDGAVGYILAQANGSTIKNNFAERSETGFKINTSRQNLFTGNDASSTTEPVAGIAVTVANTFTDNLGFALSEPLVVTESMTLAADHEGTILIGADGVTLDCAGHRIVPPGWLGDQVSHEVGIRIEGHAGVTLRNCEVAGYKEGIVLSHANDNVVNNSTATITLDDSADNEITDNETRDLTLTRSHHNLISHNTVARGEIRLRDSDNNIVDGNHVTGKGINMTESAENTVSDNKVARGQIHIHQSDGNTVRGNEVIRARANAYVIGQDASDNLVEDNTANGGRVGFMITRSDGNTISRNTAIDTKLGFQLRQSRNNTFVGNTSTAEVDLDDGPSSRSTGNTFSDNIGF